jgi:hypothetical protein
MNNPVLKPMKERTIGILTLGSFIREKNRKARKMRRRLLKTPVAVKANFEK